MATRYDSKFVIMQDDDMELFDHDLPIRTVDTTLDASRRRAQGSANPTLLPKSAYSAQYWENKSLRDRGGSIHTGAIYQLHDQ
jgi:hypothetical protein